MSLDRIDAQKLVELQQSQIESQARLIEILQKAIERQRQSSINLDELDDLI